MTRKDESDVTKSLILTLQVTSAQCFLLVSSRCWLQLWFSSLNRTVGSEFSWAEDDWQVRLLSHLQRQDGLMQRSIREVNTSSHCCVLWDLQEDTHYSVQVRHLWSPLKGTVETSDVIWLFLCQKISNFTEILKIYHKIKISVIKISYSTLKRPLSTSVIPP